MPRVAANDTAEAQLKIPPAKLAADTVIVQILFTANLLEWLRKSRLARN